MSKREQALGAIRAVAVAVLSWKMPPSVRKVLADLGRITGFEPRSDKRLALSIGLPSLSALASILWVVRGEQAQIADAATRASGAVNDWFGSLDGPARLTLIVGASTFVALLLGTSALQEHLATRRIVKAYRKADVPSRSLEFSPEYREAGVAILSYFATYVENKYPDESVTVQIEQDGPKVTMTVRTEEGHEEIIEKALEEYGLVVTGEKKPEDVLENPSHILDLRDQLQSAYTRSQSKTEALQLTKAENARLLQENAFLRSTTVEDKGALVAEQQGRAVEAARAETFREALRMITSSSQVVVNNAPTATANSTSKATASASATVNITGPVYAIQGALRELAETLPADSPAREEIETVDAGLEIVAKETDAEAIQKASALSRLRGLVEDLGDDKSRVGKAVKGLGSFARISKTIAAEAAKIAAAIGAAGMVG